MSSFLGMGYRMTRNPYWFNAKTGEIVQTPEAHHSRVFPQTPQVLNLPPDEVRFKVGGEAFTNAFATVMLEHGWCRIDVASDDESQQSFIGGQKRQLTPGTVAIIAPTGQAAHAALLKISELTRAPVATVTVVVSGTATKDTREVQTFALHGTEIRRAVARGLAEWCHGEDHKPVTASKMMPPKQGRCPFGFSA